MKSLVVSSFAAMIVVGSFAQAETLFRCGLLTQPNGAVQPGLSRPEILTEGGKTFVSYTLQGMTTNTQIQLKAVSKGRFVSQDGAASLVMKNDTVVLHLNGTSTTCTH